MPPSYPSAKDGNKAMYTSASNSYLVAIKYGILSSFVREIRSEKI